MRILTWRGWVVAIVVGGLSAALTFFGLLQIAHWRVDEAQLHQIVQLIQSGRLKVEPMPTSVPEPPK